VAQGTIDYYTADLTAVAGQDYTQTAGTLTYTGHGGNTIRVPIIQDGLLEGEEQFEVRLTNFRGSFVNRGRETAVVRILHDDSPKQSSDNSARQGQSNQQTDGSQAGSSARPASPPSAVPASSEPTNAGSESGGVNLETLPGEPGAGDEADPLVGKRVQNHDEPPSSPLTDLGILLFVAIALAAFWAKKRIRRRWTPNP
jgi:hypothetical protein